MSQAHAAPLAAWGEHTRPLDYLRQIEAVAEADVRKLIHDPVELFTRMIQPVLWLGIFGEVFSRTRAIPTGGLRYLDFMTPGVLAQSVLFGAIFYGISLIWERDLGIVHKFLASPTPRSALVLGRSVSSMARSVCQMILVYILAVLLGVHLQIGFVAIVGVTLAVVLGSAIFSTFSLIAACIVKSRERFMGIGQVLTMPLFFASNAIYPLSMMPNWLKDISIVNPLTYQVDALRGLMVTGGTALFGFGHDFGALLVIFAVLVGIATALYPKIIT